MRSPMGPNALANYDYRTQKWTSNRPSKACRLEIWEKLERMQGKYCAYCERIVPENDRHIEHFFHKGSKPDGTAPYRHLTFEWSNLFGCCGKASSDTCGHYKDRVGSGGPGPYNPNELIKPDTDDPSLFFEFLDTGVIEAKQDLSPQDMKKANETIRVLNLLALNGVRKRAIDRFKRELIYIESISKDLTDEQLNKELARIKSSIRKNDYQTAVLSSLDLL